MNLVNINSVVASAIQQGILVPGFQQPMDSLLAFSLFTFDYDFAGRIGVEQTFTKSARLPVSLTPAVPANQTADLDNGMTAAKAGVEQYSITLDEWDALDKIELLGDEAMIASDLTRSLDNLGVHAATRKDRLVRKAFLDSYLSGNTRVVSGGTTDTTHAQVNDIRGFQKTIDATGKLVDVSSGNPILVDEINSSGAVVQTLSVTGVNIDVTNISDLKNNGLGGISGQLVFTTASAPTVGNALKERKAPMIFRAGGRVHSDLITAGDIGNVDLMDDAVVYLRNQGHRGQLYCIAGPSFMRQLRRDPQFQLAYQGRFEAPEIRNAKVTEFGGVRYIETTEVPIHTNTLGVNVNRALLLTMDEVCMEAVYQGFDHFIQEKQQDNTVHYEKVQSNCALFVPAPIDTKRRVQPIGYSMVTGFCCGTDYKTDETIIPTASKAKYKKAAWLEFAA